MLPQAFPDANALVVTVAEIDGVLRREGADARQLVLEGYGLSAEGYLEAKAAVRARIAAENAAGKGETVVVYAAAFRRAREAPQFSLDPSFKVGAARASSVPAPAPAHVLGAEPTSSGAALPTYLARSDVPPAPAPTPPPAAAAAATSSPSRPPGAHALSGTIAIRLDEVGGAAMPFAPGAPGVASIALAEPDPKPKPARKSLSATGEIDARRLKGSPLPFPPRASAGEGEARGAGERWTLQQYASLCAESSMPRGLSPERLVAYHLRDQGELEAVHRTWSRKLEAEPELHKEWARLRAQYIGWLTSR